MKQFSRFLLVAAALVMACGCAQKSGAPLEDQEAANFVEQKYQADAGEKLVALTTVPANAAKAQIPSKSTIPANPAGKQVVSKAKSALGTPYVYGGSAPGGFDCSGLVKWSYSHIGVTLPRTAREQSVVGEKIRNVEDMRAGDIVAFRHPKRGYHTGIYVGDGKFVHSPRRKTTVRINSLSDPYFRETLLGARRINMQAGENLVAQAQARLDEVIAEKTKLSVSSKNKRAIQARKAQATAAKNSKKNSKTVAANKQGQSLKEKKVSADKKGAKLGKNDKKNGASKQTVAKASTKASSKASAARAKTAQAKSEHAKHAQTKNAKTKTTASGAKKNSDKTVSMLNKKAQPKQTAKRKHS